MAIPCQHWTLANSINFVTEVRKADGDYYSPASVNELLSDFWTFSDFKRSSCVHG